MDKECREEVTLIENNSLLQTLEHYLRKHKYNNDLCIIRIDKIRFVR